MHCVTVDYPSDWTDARIYILSDLHIGDPQSDPESIAERISRISEDDHGLCVLNGDILNTAVRNSVSDVYGELMSPMDQIKLASDLLRPISGRIISADTGNHENRTYKNDGVDIMRLVCRELGVEKCYAPEGVLCFLRFGTQSSRNKNKPFVYSIYSTHGTGGGRKEGAKAIRLADMASIVDADVYIHSHSHLPMIMKQNFFRVDIQHQCTIPVTKLFVNDSSSLNYGGYGQAGEYKPYSKESPVIHLDGKTKRMSATL